MTTTVAINVENQCTEAICVMNVLAIIITYLNQIQLNPFTNSSLAQVWKRLWFYLLATPSFGNAGIYDPTKHLWWDFCEICQRLLVRNCFTQNLRHFYRSMSDQNQKWFDRREKFKAKLNVRPDYASVRP